VLLLVVFAIEFLGDFLSKTSNDGGFELGMRATQNEGMDLRRILQTELIAVQHVVFDKS
jgi:hypothetical protein